MGKACFVPHLLTSVSRSVRVTNTSRTTCTLNPPPLRSNDTYSRRAFLHSCLHLAVFSTLNPSNAAENLISDIDPRNAEPDITDRVYLDMSLNDGSTSRITIGLYGTIAPETVANFKALAMDGFAGTSVYRVVPGLTVQLGDVLHNGGRSGRSAIGDGQPFPEENFRVMHSMPGLVSMVHDRNGLVDSRFFVNTRPGDSAYLDGKYCAFGRVVDNLGFFYEVERAAEKGNTFARRTPKVTIASSGVLP